MVPKVLLLWSTRSLKTKLAFNWGCFSCKSFDETGPLQRSVTGPLSFFICINILQGLIFDVVLFTEETSFFAIANNLDRTTLNSQNLSTHSHIFICFNSFSVASKRFMRAVKAFIKNFEVPQKSLKIKI